MKNKLPSLEPGKGSEARHAAIEIAIGDLPEERTVAFHLHFEATEVGRISNSPPLRAMALRALLLKQLRASGLGGGIVGEGIVLALGARRRLPARIGMRSWSLHQRLS